MWSRLSLTDAIAFLYVCENEGINLSEVAQLARLTPSAASRCAHRLSLPPLGLVSIERQERDCRGRVVKLTPKGVAIRQQLNDLLVEATPILGG